MHDFYIQFDVSCLAPSSSDEKIRDGIIYSHTDQNISVSWHSFYSLECIKFSMNNKGTHALRYP